MKWLHGITNTMDRNVGQVQEMMRDRKAWCAVAHGSQKSDMTGDSTTTNGSKCNSVVLHIYIVVKDFRTFQLNLYYLHHFITFLKGSMMHPK